MENKIEFFYKSKFGIIKICTDNNKISFVKKIEKNNFNNNTTGKSELISKTIIQLEEYFAGKRKIFDLPIKLIGTEFQIKVWNELKKIPYGETRSYKQIAESIGNPKAVRAVGLANNKNPITIIIPCHRVIGSNGKLVGYAGGINMKKQLLDLENNFSIGN